MLVSGAAELISLGAVLPFLAVLDDPGLLWQKPLVKYLASLIGVSTENQLVLTVTIVFALAASLAALIRLFNLRLNFRLAAAIGSDLSCEAYRRTLYQPYEVHLRRNSANVITSTTTHIANNARVVLTTPYVLSLVF